ncbi:magnesium transporter CorA family protein [Mycobacterium gastri]|uniref:Magnesium transporter n=1 Tax=Mycobacterium gastri TaxID=1777 RepID=A0A1X1VV01_MYCGS|nr:magnesium transporter CorA family protein [Mycobacterium gastri]ETW25209.1 magnesium transporter [Mycobacterium gastri 'Wayne']ORV72892.1 magnesium transporter [Mycobacterium gastri]
MQVAPSNQGRVWRGGEPQDDFEFDRISDYLVEDDTLVWVDLCEPDHDTLRELAAELGLNPWAVEDAVAVAERVKATAYETHTFFTVYAVDVVTRADADPQPMLAMHRISAFVLARGLITVRLTPDFDMAQVTRQWREIGGQRHGVGALVHGLLDVVVDSHFAAVEALDDCIEAIEDELFDGSSRQANFQRRTFQLRRDLVNLRRVALPMREVVNSIQHHRLHAPQADAARELDPLYADLYDHVLRVSEWTESLRDMVTTIFETNLSLQDARLNTVMKKLTGWAAIIAVPTAITGYYGQNIPYPGFGSVSGFIVSTSVIVVLMVVLYVTFRRRDWL